MANLHATSPISQANKEIQVSCHAISSLNLEIISYIQWKDRLFCHTGNTTFSEHVLQMPVMTGRSSECVEPLESAHRVSVMKIKVFGALAIPNWPQ